MFGMYKTKFSISKCSNYGKWRKNLLDVGSLYNLLTLIEFDREHLKNNASKGWH